MVSFYDYRTYTEFLHNISVQHATYEIIVHNIWFHFNTKHGHMLFILLYMCCATFIYKLSVGTTYSSYHTHPVKATFLSHNSCEHINRSHGTRDYDWVDSHSDASCCTRTLAMGVPLNLFKECLIFVSWLLNYCRGIFLRSEMNSAGFLFCLKPPHS